MADGRRKGPDLALLVSAEAHGPDALNIDLGADLNKSMRAEGPKIAIVGGGLAGMIAAVRLLERGCAVTIFESSERLGGKAGAERHGENFDEHAYHIFPAWYLNAGSLAHELDITTDFVECPDLVFLKQGDVPGRSYTYHNITSWKDGLRNIFAGVIPPIDMFLFFCAVCDLLGQPYSKRAYLDQISVMGFIRSKVYRTRNVELQFEELILKGLSVPTYELSAMTMSKVMSFWVRNPSPTMRILKGNLQEYWISPIQQKIEALGGKIEYHHELRRIHVSAGTASSLEFVKSDSAESPHLVAVDRSAVVIAIPPEKVGQLIDDELYRAEPQLGNIRKLNTEPLAAFDIYLNRTLPDIPRAHVLLLESQYAISFIDVSQFWEGYTHTVLNCMASDFAPLLGLTSDGAVEALLSEMQKYLPQLRQDDIAHVEMQFHATHPLFTNNVGAWQFRPTESEDADLRTAESMRIPNLYLAGDYCRSFIDLVSMEGALSTGLIAAEAIRQDLQLPGPIEILRPPTSPVLLWRVLNVLAWPPASVLGWVSRRRENTQ